MALDKWGNIIPEGWANTMIGGMVPGPGNTPQLGPIGPGFPEPALTPTTPASPTFQPANTNPFAPIAANNTPTSFAPSQVGTGGFSQPYQTSPTGLSLMDQATTWNATTGSVGNNETVAKQLESLLAANSPYVQQARARAAERANERGLLNSSLAAGAGEEAAIAQALPIAQQDASTYLNQAQRNQQYSNAASSQNATMGFNTRQLGEQARQFDNDAGFKTQSLLETARQFNTGIGLEDRKLFETARQSDNANQLQARALQEEQRQFDNNQISQLSMFNRETASREQIAQLDAATKTYLAKTEAEYKNQMQSSASAAQMYQEYTQGVSAILNNDKLDQANKQAALNILKQQLDDGMRLLGHIGTLDLSSLLTFPGPTAGSPAPAPSTALPPTNTPSAGVPGAPASYGGRYPIVQQMYAQYLGRAPEPGAAEGWEATIDSWFQQGMTGDQINARLAQEFQNTQEARNYQGSGAPPYVAPPAAPGQPAAAPLDPMSDPSRSPGPGYYWHNPGPPYRGSWQPIPATYEGN